MTTMTTPAISGGATTAAATSAAGSGGRGHSSVRVLGGRTPSPSSSSYAASTASSSSAPVSPIAAPLGSPTAGPPPLLFLLQHAAAGGDGDGWGADPTATFARLLVGIAEKGRLPRLRLALSQIHSTHPHFLPSPHGRLALRLCALAAGGRGHWDCLTHLITEHQVPVARLSEGETEAAASRWGPHLLKYKLPPAPPGLGATAAEEAALHAAARAWLLAPPLVAAAAAGDVVQALKLVECAEAADIKALKAAPAAGKEGGHDSVLHLLADGGLWRRHRGGGVRRERTQSQGSALSGSIGGSLVSCCGASAASGATLSEDEEECDQPQRKQPEEADDDDARAPALAALISQLAAAAPALLHKRDNEGHLPICRAAATGHVLALRLLLEAHRAHGGLADVELALRRPCQSGGGCGNTVAVPLLAHAMRAGQTRCLRLLLLDSQLAKQHQGRRTPLVDATAPCGHTAPLPSAVTVMGEDGNTSGNGMVVPCLPHHLAALHAWEPALRWLLAHGGVGVDAPVSATGHTALHFVCLGGGVLAPGDIENEEDGSEALVRLRLARWLVEEQGADPAKRDRMRGETPAEAAARVGRTALAAYLLPLVLAAEEAAAAEAAAAAAAEAEVAAKAMAEAAAAKEEEAAAFAKAEPEPEPEEPGFVVEGAPWGPAEPVAAPAMEPEAAKPEQPPVAAAAEAKPKKKKIKKKKGAAAASTTPTPPPPPPSTPLEEEGGPQQAQEQQPPKLALPPSILQLAAASAAGTGTSNGGAAADPITTQGQRRRRRLARLTAALAATEGASSARAPSLLLRVPPVGVSSPLLSTMAASSHHHQSATAEPEECERSRTGSLSSLSLSLGVPEEEVDEVPLSPTGSICSFFSARSREEGADAGVDDVDDMEEEHEPAPVAPVEAEHAAPVAGVDEEEQEAPASPVPAATEAPAPVVVVPAAEAEEGGEGDEKQEGKGSVVVAVSGVEKRAEQEEEAPAVAAAVVPVMMMEKQQAQKEVPAPAQAEEKVVVAKDEGVVMAPAPLLDTTTTTTAPTVAAAPPASPTSLLKSILFQGPKPTPAITTTTTPAASAPIPQTEQPLPAPAPARVAAAAAVATEAHAPLLVVPAHLLDSLPPEFCCPLTKQLLEDPYIGMDGVTYERAALQEWIAGAMAENRPVVSPSTGEPMAPVCVPNHSLKLLIKDYLRTEARKQAKLHKGLAAAPRAGVSAA